jgi:hypothetical protein
MRLLVWSSLILWTVLIWTLAGIGLWSLFPSSLIP